MKKKIVLFLLFALALAAFGQRPKEQVRIDTAGGKVYRIRLVELREEIPDSTAILAIIADLEAQRDTLTARIARAKQDLRTFRRLSSGKKGGGGNKKGPEAPKPQAVLPNTSPPKKN